MFEAISLLILLSVLLLIIGTIKPSYVYLWNGKKAKGRWKVFLFYGGVIYLLCALGMGAITSWLFALALIGLLTTGLSLILLLIGLVRPRIVLPMKKNTRRKVVSIYSFVFITSMAIVISASMSEDEGAVLPSARYDGERLNGEKHGTGKTFNRSSYYEGEWVHNVREGYGTEVTSFGSVLDMRYEGEWKENLHDGYGTEVVSLFGVETTYEGDYKNGVRHGYGKFTDRSGSSYEGDWKEDAPNGSGEIRTKDGEIYVGEVMDWERHGRGKAVTADGKVTEGIWENGEFVK
ncbi:MORN repeat-containing protein [Pseudalkalibacillus hwajinpoensis]|uniref:MORN repeat-containing protein n=1 Tax=Guptibacillus hwajinpoensis TaxID=208199 RepID=UPI001CFEA6BC|nr:hypothetical protein [Pseudalkalibacillus hwajinpoensis]